MARAISIAGPLIPKPEPKPSYRSKDGSDLPARVTAAAKAFKEETGRIANAVRLGRQECEELDRLLKAETNMTDFRYHRVTVCGLSVFVEPVDTMIEAEYVINAKYRTGTAT